MPDPFADVPRELKQGRYRLVAAIGTGGAAEVWRAKDKKTGRSCAIKVLHKGADSEVSSRFLAEAKVMNALQHPRIVNVFDVGRDEGWYWFAMDIHPHSLRDRIADGPVPPLTALKWTHQLLAGLAAAHARGVIHRDVKPANVLINTGEHVVLADFGVARHRPEDVPHRTMGGAFLGSFGYAAPEQRKSARDVTPQADLYSVGAVLYAMVTGNNPADLALPETVESALRPLTPELRDIVQKACAYEPALRYTSADAMAADVEAAWIRSGGKGALVAKPRGCLFGWF